MIFSSLVFMKFYFSKQKSYSPERLTHSRILICQVNLILSSKIISNETFYDELIFCSFNDSKITH